MMLQHLRTLHAYTLHTALSGTCRYDFLTQQSSRSHLPASSRTNPSISHSLQSHSVSNLTQSPISLSLPKLIPSPILLHPNSTLHMLDRIQWISGKSSLCDGYMCGVSLLHWSQTGPRGLKSVSCRNYRFCACSRLHYTV
jgi:hypothetical protein